MENNSDAGWELGPKHLVAEEGLHLVVSSSSSQMDKEAQTQFLDVDATPWP